MPENELETATPVANPSDENSGAVSAPESGSQIEAPTTGSSQQSVSMPDEAYKGMQRALEREKARARELEARLQQAVSSPVDANSATVVNALLQEIARDNPERAAALSQAYNNYRLAAENEALRNQQAVQEQERMYRDAQERNMQELRATAAAFGVDPNSPLIDYGDPDTDSIAERLSKVRSSAMAAAKPATPVTPPARTAETVHNTQPGTPPAPPASRAGTVTEEQLAAAQANYSRAYQTMTPEARQKADAELRELTDRYAQQLFA